ncbi:RluA family pseudouridine synthase [Ruminococcaceae bacterium OttesenSCG-928-I18]|nr:RluA family pseudouridine synthase [Ruminococcaceae bacterium OttesenSCG-928-I18]
MNQIETTVLPCDAGLRIDRFIALRCSLSRSVAQRLLEEGHVLLNGQNPAKSRLLAAGDHLFIEIPLPKESPLLAEEIPLDIFYEDAHLLVVDKPKGMVVHPSPGHDGGTLVNALLHHCTGGLSGIGGELRPGIVHRIDKDTSGLLVVAKDDETHAGLSAQFAQHSIHREYQAVVYGRFKEPTGQIDAPIGRSHTDRKKMAVTQRNAKQALTFYEVVAEYPGFTHLKLRLQTGRTHQIRVHMAEIGHPVAGDTVYGPKNSIGKLKGQCLHAGRLGFVHPVTQRELLFESPLPPYFADFLRKLYNTRG